jgi:hypothetical protein
MKYQRLPFCVACATQESLGPQKLGGITITLCEDCRNKARGPRSLDHGDKIKSALAKRKQAGLHVGHPETVSSDPTRSRRSDLRRGLTFARLRGYGFRS